MDKKYVRKKELLSSRMDNEIVMMHPESGKYFALNPVASRIWDLLETPHNLNELVEKLLKEFDVSEETCCKEVSAFLKEMSEKKLVVISE
ncbi:MAG: PqqD family protein [Bacteroidetes bacterium CG02_land_8_20_14_3_00_31_25]|nr:MAG: PqqD family protein [Bacteroidetes bacterium CG02_land_8_20_14_3_00_31_25]PIY03128.1 MAG: PqqD family protein [Bacteroidetes bacterium CG_4_10_14_3_um_filter_31_20]